LTDTPADVPPGGPGDEAQPGSVLSVFDRRVEELVAPRRGRPALDAAAVVVSNLADYGLAWSLLAALKARRRGPARRRAVATLAVAGVASASVNAALKARVGRHRPEPSGQATDGLPVRTPTSTSFPSGHTLAAFCTAVALAESPGEQLAYLGFATAVGASRLQLGAHHATDVVGGAAAGAGLGLVVRRLVGRRA